MMKSESARGLEWLPAVLAAAALVVFAAAFVYELLSYQTAVVGWAKGDLEARARLAADRLEDPLRTQNMREIQRLGNEFAVHGLRLRVTGVHGGIGMVFDTHRDADGGYLFSDRHESGDYDVLLGMPRAQVTAPFRRALLGFALAGLVGVAGVLLFFFVTYRQRVRIRELAKLEKFRREFIADVSHEIRTPLTGIMGAVELLSSSSCAPRIAPPAELAPLIATPSGRPSVGGYSLGGYSLTSGKDSASPLLLSMLKTESVRLNGLVQSILDLARLEREGDVLNLETCELGELVRETAAKYPCVCTVKSSGTVRCDPQLVEQAVSNLIANAVRHSGSKEISVTVECGGGTARIVVEDHGVGIPPEHAARIFERFHRVDPARAAETGGAGLGLAIVRRIARLHGGDVTLAPAKPQGCRFAFSIPM